MTLDEWLAFIERQHARPIDLGLDRLRGVGEALGQRQTCPLILVGGTNGKGSTCAMLESILRCAGYRVGLYSSPHLLRYNERVRVDGRPVTDEALCNSFSRVEAVRGGVPLTYFEFGTLAALEVFAEEALDAVILEVGLGGRLDATNLYQPDVSIVTTVDIDHIEYLGATREAIGFEKAGIFRTGRSAICGDTHPPQSLIEHAVSIGADLQVLGRQFGFERQEGQWQYWSQSGRRSGLAFPAIRGGGQLANASCVLAALDVLHGCLPVAMQDIRRGLLESELPGRCQVVPGRPALVLDVAHNPQAVAMLADSLGRMTFCPTTWGIFGMMGDKDILGVVRAIRHRIDRWLPVDLGGPRAASAAELARVLGAEGIDTVSETFASPSEALAHARAVGGEDDRIVTFGSFLTVADVLRSLGRAMS